MDLQRVFITYKYPAKNVLIAGTFTEWTGMPMIKIYDDLWVYPTQIPPGTYQYKFIVDGIWCLDIEKPHVHVVDNIRNNVVVVLKKTLVILRGASGSGKTTLGRKLLETHGGITYAEADKLMKDETGKYFFDPKKLTACHLGSVNEVVEAMDREDSYIVVSNTSLLYWEMYKYVKIALDNGYTMKFMEPDTEWRYDAKTLITKNEHHVPIHSIQHQLGNLKLNPTLSTTPEMIEAILKTEGIRPTTYRNGINQTQWKFLYYGLSGHEISNYCEKLKNHLGENLYAQCSQNLRNRDGGKTELGDTMYHVTLTNFNPKDREILTSEQWDEYFQKLLEIKSKPRCLGIGKVENGEDVSFFLVVEWNVVNDIRREFKLGPLDLHVTLGFIQNDIHDVPKIPETIFIQ